MDVFKEIVQYSALGMMSKWYKNLVLLLFSTIVTILLTMLAILIVKGPEMTIQFGY
jgi:hypothetical protein